MAHRYATRSKTPITIIDLTQTPHVRKSRRRARVSATGANRPNEQTISEEMILEVRDDSIENKELIDASNEACILPCLNNSFTGRPEVITCSICFEGLSAGSEPMATHCGHIFCAGCLAMSLKKFERCPTCQTPAKFSTSIRLYF